MKSPQSILSTRGINYDVGTYFGKFRTGAYDLDQDAIERDFRVIRDKLCCNAVQIYGNSPERIELAATIALDLGFSARIEPRLVDGPQSEASDQLRDVARVGQRLRERGGKVTLTIGCELSIFSPGIIEGATFQGRIARLAHFGGEFAEVNRALDARLSRLVSIARQYFTGDITYAAAPWEGPDWSGFDIIGLDHYRMALNHATYTATLRQHVHSGKPVAITEFGCCAYEGAADLGPSGYDIVDWSARPPRIRDGIVRDEQEQARYIWELIAIFRQERVAAAFVYTFSNPDLVHNSDPHRDLDLASFGIVKTVSPPMDGSYQWTRKRAFDVVAEAFASDTPR